MNQENLSFARTAFSNLIGKALLPNSICYCEILRDNPIFKGASYCWCFVKFLQHHLSLNYSKY